MLRYLILIVALTAQTAWAAGEDRPRLVVQTGHSGPVTALAFSPHGRVLASGGYDKTVKLWDVASGKELRAMGGHREEISCLAFSPDGATLASGGDDESVIVHDAATGRELHALTAHGKVKALQYAPDGRMLAYSTGAGTIGLYDIAEARLLRELKAHGGRIQALAFSADGRTLVSATVGDDVKVWDVASGELRRSYLANAKGIGAVVRLPGDNRFALAGMDGTIRIWDVAHDSQLAQLSGHKGVVNSLSVSADGRILTSIGSDSTVRQWDVETGDALSTAEAPGYIAGNPRWSLSGTATYLFAASPDAQVVAWGEYGRISLRDHGVLRTLRGEADEMQALQFFGKALGAYVWGAGGMALWSPESGRMNRRFAGDDLPLRETDDSLLVLPATRRKPFDSLSWGRESDDVALWDLDAGRVKGTLPAPCVQAAAMTPGGRTIATVGRCAPVYTISDEGKLVQEEGRPRPKGRPGITLWDAASRRALRSLDTGNLAVMALAFSPDGRSLASSANDQVVRLWQAGNGKELRRLRDAEPRKPDWAQSLAFSPDGKVLAEGMLFSGEIELHSVADGTLLKRLTGHAGTVAALAFSPDGRFLVSTGEDMTLRYWRLADGAHVATLYSFSDDSWVVTDPAGRFDASNLDEIKGLHWVMPDDPMTPVPLEAFMKDYYEPRLLTRILDGERFKPVRAVSELNRVQPDVRIVGIRPDPVDASYLQVEIEVAAASRAYLRDGKSVPVATAAHDLRLFRNGQLVGHVDGLVTEQGGVPVRQSFAVRLPSAAQGQDIAFSAYVFNDDRIKSATARATYSVAATPERPRRAFVIGIGVNEHDNPAWNLKFAANDARLFRKAVGDRLARTGQFDEIVSVALISDGNERNADKAMLRAVLDRLAGKPASPLLADLPGAARLQAATPDDLVLISFSGHGHAGSDGEFYLLAQDTGPGQGKRVDEALLGRSISSEELSFWLRDVDAGDMTLIVDACQSAASVQGNDFKPGPMGSRGLGQLSFDKGMRILAASQADEYALENDRIRQGLLSFALVTDGIEGFAADRAPKDSRIMLDEWLRYGVDRVPALADEIERGNVRIASRGGQRGLVRTTPGGKVKPRPAQQPSLFDFARDRRPVELAGRRK